MTRLPLGIPIATALRRALAGGYTLAALRADVLSGVVVGVVALPLSMALAIAVGVAPQYGLYTTVVAGLLTALTGGSSFQVTGPTAAFVVILAPITERFGFAGLLTAGLMAGVILVAMGVARLGRFIQFIPHPVTTGFTAGIATVIATLQLKDALGLHVERMPNEYLEKLAALWAARGGVSPAECATAAATLALLLAAPKVTRRVPAPLVAVGSVSIAVALLHGLWPGFEPATVGTRFHSTIGGLDIAGIPRLPPAPMLPWRGGPASLSELHELLPPALTIAMLGAIESLLSAVVADGMTGQTHDPDAELVGQGLGNIVAPFFGGIAATGALARTATNVRSGARSPIAAATHAVVVLLAVLLFAPLVGYVPMASLAALLLLVAWNMSEARHALHVLRVAPKSDVAVLLACYALTVVFDMVIAVGVGVVLAALLFMRRMAELTRAQMFAEGPAEAARELPPGVVLYEIAGALFFGAAQKAMGALGAVGTRARVVVLGLGRVPVIDATGLVALESALERLRRAKKFVLIAGPLPEPRSIFEKARLEAHMDHVLFSPSLDEAMQTARDLALLNPDWGAPLSPEVPPPSSRPA